MTLAELIPKQSGNVRSTGDEALPVGTELLAVQHSLKALLVNPGLSPEEFTGIDPELIPYLYPSSELYEAGTILADEVIAGLERGEGPKQPLIFPEDDRYYAFLDKFKKPLHRLNECEPVINNGFFAVIQEVVESEAREEDLITTVSTRLPSVSIQFVRKNPMALYPTAAA